MNLFHCVLLCLSLFLAPLLVSMELPKNPLPSTSMSSPLDESDRFIEELAREDNHATSTTIPQSVNLFWSEQAQQNSPVEHDEDDRSTILSHASDAPFFFDSEFFESTLGGEDLDIKPLKQLLLQTNLYIEQNHDPIQRCIRGEYGVKAQQYAQQALICIAKTEDYVAARDIHLNKVKKCLHCCDNSYQNAYLSDKKARQYLKDTQQYLQAAKAWIKGSLFYYLTKIKPYGRILTIGSNDHSLELWGYISLSEVLG